MQTLNILLSTLFFVLMVVKSYTVKINSTVSHELKNKSPITIASEGGTIVSNNSTAQLSDDYLNLINLESGLDKSNKSSIKARKKADFLSVEDVTVSPVKNKIVTDNTSLNTNSTLLNKTVISTKGNASNFGNNTLKLNHKPLILSYEALAQTDEVNKIFIADNEPNIKVQIKTNSHPGMIMPIIITVLVVPMFAVVGYMALKRGREAWKNRHYKRMDFLLDGMYNE